MCITIIHPNQIKKGIREMKKFLSIALVVAMMLTMVVVNVSAAAWNGTASTAFTGEGTATSPYLIADGANLKYLQEQVAAGTTYEGKYFTQTADIDLGGNEWTPIGTSSQPFCGVYDGCNKTITGLKITKVETDFVGLFGYVSSSATYEAGIANLKVVGEITADNVTRGAGIGGVVGWLAKDNATTVVNKNYLLNVVSDVDVTLTNVSGQIRTGAVMGYAFYALIENVTNEGNLSITGTQQIRSGGVCGQTNRTTFKNCTNNGNVTVDIGDTVQNVRLGGFAGVITRGGKAGDESSAVGVVFEGCVNNGNLSAKGGNTVLVGGIWAEGYVNNTTWPGKDLHVDTLNCVNTGKVVAETASATAYAHAGAITGYPGNGYDYYTFVNCVNTGEFDSVGGGSDRGCGLAATIYAPDATNIVIDNCVTVGKIKASFSFANSAEALNTSTADATPAQLVAAIEALPERTASTAKIAGFTLAESTFAPPATPTPEIPPVESGDGTMLIVLIALVSLAGAVAVKKISVR